jgi:hypothetical protein
MDMTIATRPPRSAGTLLCVAALLAAAAWRPTAAVAAFQAGQAVEVREGDTWSSATVLKREGRRYQVHYANSDAASDEWVGPDRIRLPGGATPPPAGPPADVPTAVTPPADTAPAPTRPPVSHRSRPKPEDMFAEPDEVMPVTVADRSAVDAEQPADAPAAWSVKPDGPAVDSSGGPQTYGLRGYRSDGQGMSVKQLLPCAGGGAIVGWADFFDKARAVERVGPAGSAYAELPAQSLPLAASPDGTLLVCRCKAFGFGNNARIDAYTLSAAAATPLVSFKPYPDETGDGKGEDVRFAAALSDTRIVTCDLKGRLVAWDIRAGAATGVWRADVGEMRFGGDDTDDVVLSPGGRWLAAAGKGRVTFVDATTGHVLGAVDAPTLGSLHALTCSPSGRTLLARANDDGALVSIDLAAGKLGRLVALSPSTGGRLACPDDGFALLGGRVLVDARTGATVPRFQPSDVGSTLAVTGPGVTLLASNERVSAVHMPDPMTRANVAATGDAALALRPGAEVSLDISLPGVSAADRDAVEAALRQKLVDDGFVIKDSADTVVVCLTEPGQQHEHVYAKASPGMAFTHMGRMGFGGSGESLFLTDKVTRLTILNEGRKIWERTRVCGPANTVMLREGESMEDAVKATIVYDPAFLMGVMIPPYIAKPAANEGLPPNGRRVPRQLSLTDT